MLESFFSLIYYFFDILASFRFDFVQARPLAYEVISLNDIFQLLLGHGILVKHQHVIQFNFAAVVFHHVFKTYLGVFEVVAAFESRVLILSSTESVFRF